MISPIMIYASEFRISLLAGSKGVHASFPEHFIIEITDTVQPMESKNAWNVILTYLLHGAEFFLRS